MREDLIESLQNCLDYLQQEPQSQSLQTEIFLKAISSISAFLISQTVSVESEDSDDYDDNDDDDDDDENSRSESLGDYDDESTEKLFSIIEEDENDEDVNEFIQEQTLEQNDEGTTSKGDIIRDFKQFQIDIQKRLSIKSKARRPPLVASSSFSSGAISKGRTKERPSPIERYEVLDGWEVIGSIAIVWMFVDQRVIGPHIGGKARPLILEIRYVLGEPIIDLIL